MLLLNFVHTAAFAGLILFLGYGIRKVVRPFSRVNIPAPVIGGLLVALLHLGFRKAGLPFLQFNTDLQPVFMIGFFTTIGFGASLFLLKKGGSLVLMFFLASVVFAVVQNLVGMAVALPFGMHPLFGVLCGSVALTGGPATGLAFAPLFEKAGVTGASSIAVAAAMAGIVSGGLVGGPVGTFLIQRNRLREKKKHPKTLRPPSAVDLIEERLPEPVSATPAGESKSSYVLLKSVVAVLSAMWIGSWVSRGFSGLGITLPAYIGAMLSAAVIRWVDDRTGWIRLSQEVIDDIGNVALSLFIVMALMTLELWELSRLALPLIVMIIAQVVAVVLVCFWPFFRIMGRDYESAVMAGGFIGFMLGTTANAMANMESLVEKYGPAPKAFLVVPMVGAFFIDFANALIITVCLNLFG